jgi:hypothetical protein
VKITKTVDREKGEGNKLMTERMEEVLRKEEREKDNWSKKPAKREIKK